MKADEALIRWLLEESGISRYRIHKDTGIPQTTLERWVNGKTDIARMSFENAATVTAYAEKMKERKEMKTWKINNYVVEEESFDYDLHQFKVYKDGKPGGVIVPGDLDAQAEIIRDLDAGINPKGWADGSGGEIE